MCHSMSLKREFLKKWKLCLQACNSSKDMSVTEWKKLIKLSADVAMASTRHESTRWSRSVIREASRNTSHDALIKCVTTSNYCPRTTSSPISICGGKFVKRSKKMFIMRRNNALKNKMSIRRLLSVKASSSSIAKRLVSKRTRVLKSLLPGGEDIDERCLIKETLDYIVSLRAQVDVMKRIANASLLMSSTTNSK